MEQGNVVYYTIVTINSDDKKAQTKMARCVLKEMLKYLSCEFTPICTSKNGKPYFADSNVYFNYSHSKHYIACAVSGYEVGIDIEETTRHISDKVSKRYLENEDSSEKRLEKWVRKEAYSKLRGLGLLMKFQTIDLDEISNKNLFISTSNYMCAIYSDCCNAVFKEIRLNSYIANSKNIT